MTMMLLQRVLLIFTVLVCCFRSCLCDVDCERTPYHPSCRGIMAKRMYEAFAYGPFGDAYYDCSNGNCKKFLRALLNDQMNRHGGYPFNEYELSARKKLETDRKRRSDLLSELRNLNRDYFD